MKDNNVSGAGIWSVLESRHFVTIIHLDMVTIFYSLSSRTLAQRDMKVKSGLIIQPWCVSRVNLTRESA